MDMVEMKDFAEVHLFGFNFQVLFFLYKKGILLCFCLQDEFSMLSSLLDSQPFFLYSSLIHGNYTGQNVPFQFRSPVKSINA
jgi:hypothetical protein